MQSCGNLSGDGHVKTGAYCTVNKDGSHSEFPYILRWFIHTESFLVFIIHEESFMTNYQDKAHEHLCTVT